jgi:hypothetical protein
LYYFSLSELLDLANAYCEIPLKRRCEQIIKHGITIENAAMLYSTAIAYEAKVSIRYSQHMQSCLDNRLPNC